MLFFGHGLSPMAVFFARELTMCWRDLMARLGERGLTVTEAQVRWAIRTGKVARPPLDGSLRFDFGDEHLNQLVAYFGGRAVDESPTE
jgi:hypothetical protein